MSEDRGLVRYWITFGLEPARPAAPGTISLDGGQWGPSHVGVTACDLDDALALARELCWPDGDVPQVDAVIEDVDVSSLGIAGPLLGVPIWRGVWYPVTTL